MIAGYINVVKVIKCYKDGNVMTYNNMETSCIWSSSRRQHDDPQKWPLQIIAHKAPAIGTTREFIIIFYDIIIL